MTGGIKEKISNYTLEETSQLLKLVKKFNTHFMAVLNGNSTGVAYTIEEVTNKPREADQAIKKVHMMIDVAEGKKL